MELIETSDKKRRPLNVIEQANRTLLVEITTSIDLAEGNRVYIHGVQFETRAVPPTDAPLDLQLQDRPWLADGDLRMKTAAREREKHNPIVGPVLGGREAINDLLGIGPNEDVAFLPMPNGTELAAVRREFDAVDPLGSVYAVDPFIIASFRQLYRGPKDVFKHSVWTTVARIEKTNSDGHVVEIDAMAMPSIFWRLRALEKFTKPGFMIETGSAIHAPYILGLARLIADGQLGACPLHEDRP